MLTVFTSGSIAEAYDATTVCYGDDGEVIDCPTDESASADDSAASETADAATAEDNSTSDQFWI